KKEVEKIPQPVYKGSSISIDPSLLGQFRGRGRNPLDAELESEDAMLAQELKTMRVDEVILKRRARMTKLQKELDKLEKESGNMTSNSSDMPRISVAMAQQIANLPEAERNKVIETYALFRSVDKGRGGDSLLPLLIGYSKSNPGTQQSDMAVSKSSFFTYSCKGGSSWVCCIGSGGFSECGDDMSEVSSELSGSEGRSEVSD
ncbi:unnamed protein product, partial [marine sediment metagenome]